MTERFAAGSGEEIRIETDGAVATLVVDRPAQRNALSIPVCEQIDDLLSGIEADRQIRVLVVTGGHEYDPSFYTVFQDRAGIVWRHAASQGEAFRADLRTSTDVVVLYDLSSDLDAPGRVGWQRAFPGGRIARMFQLQQQRLADPLSLVAVGQQVCLMDAMHVVE